MARHQNYSDPKISFFTENIDTNQAWKSTYYKCCVTILITAIVLFVITII